MLLRCHGRESFDCFVFSAPPSRGSGSLGRRWGKKRQDDPSGLWGTRPLRSPRSASTLAARGGAGRGGEVAGQAGIPALRRASALRAVGARKVQARSQPLPRLGGRPHVQVRAWTRGTPRLRARGRFPCTEDGLPRPREGACRRASAIEFRARPPAARDKTQSPTCSLTSGHQPRRTRPAVLREAPGGAVSSPPANASSGKTHPAYPTWYATRPRLSPLVQSG